MEQRFPGVGVHPVVLAELGLVLEVAGERLEIDRVRPPALGIEEVPRGDLVARVAAPADQLLRLLEKRAVAGEAVPVEEGVHRVAGAPSRAVVERACRRAREAGPAARQPAK